MIMRRVRIRKIFEKPPATRVLSKHIISPQSAGVEITKAKAMTK